MVEPLDDREIAASSSRIKRSTTHGGAPSAVAVRVVGG